MRRCRQRAGALQGRRSPGRADWWPRPGEHGAGGTSQPTVSLFLHTPCPPHNGYLCCRRCCARVCGSSSLQTLASPLVLPFQITHELCCTVQQHRISTFLYTLFCDCAGTCGRACLNLWALTVQQRWLPLPSADRRCCHGPYHSCRAPWQQPCPASHWRNSPRNRPRNNCCSSRGRGLSCQDRVSRLPLALGCLVHPPLPTCPQRLPPPRGHCRVLQQRPAITWARPCSNTSNNRSGPAVGPCCRPRAPAIPATHLVPHLLGRSAAPHWALGLVVLQRLQPAWTAQQPV